MATPCKENNKANARAKVIWTIVPVLVVFLTICPRILPGLHLITPLHPMSQTPISSSGAFRIWFRGEGCGVYGLGILVTACHKQDNTEYWYGRFPMDCEIAAEILNRQIYLNLSRHSYSQALTKRPVTTFNKVKTLMIM